MSVVKIHSGQSLLDICIQEYGSVEALVHLAKENDVPLDHIPEAGDMVKVSEQVSFKPEVVKYFKDRGRSSILGVGRKPPYDL